MTPLPVNVRRLSGDSLSVASRRAPELFRAGPGAFVGQSVLTRPGRNAGPRARRRRGQRGVEQFHEAVQCGAAIGGLRTMSTGDDAQPAVGADPRAQ